MSKINQSEVMEIIETALEMNSGLLYETTRSEEVENWDSLGQLSILVALDKLFDGKIANLTQMAEADSMPKILDILKQHSLI